MKQRIKSVNYAYKEKILNKLQKKETLYMDGIFAYIKLQICKHKMAFVGNIAKRLDNQSKHISNFYY